MKQTIFSKSSKANVYFMLICVLYIFYFYSSILLQPNDYLFSAKGDGLKTFFVYMFHIKNDISLNETSSINYPYGEVHLFTDGQTLFANLFKALDYISPWFGDHAIGFLNVLMITSYFISFQLVYKIFLKLKLNNLFAGISSFILVILSPQIFRFGGHPSLAYVFIIPLFIYYLQCYFITYKKKYLGYLIVFGSIFPFIHPYYLLTYLLLVATFSLLYYLNDFLRVTEKKSNNFLLILTTLIPLFVSLIYLKVFDHHLNRSEHPYGLLVYCSSLQTIFLPVFSNFERFIIDFLEVRYQEWEGWAYLGAATLFGLLILFSYQIKSIFNRRFKKAILISHNPFIFVAFYAGVIILVYAMAIPFKVFDGKLLDVVPQLAQFRSLGRFAWITFYLFGIVGFYFIFLFWRNAYKSKFRYAIRILICIPLIVGFLEGTHYHNELSKQIVVAPNLFKLENLSLEDNYIVKTVTEEYQALIPLPFFHFGSEGSTRYTNDRVFEISMLLSYYSKIPLVASSSARTSRTEARDLVQLLSPAYMKKLAKDDFKDKRPLLIMTNKADMQFDEKQLLDRAQFLFQSSDLYFYKIDLDTLLAYNTNEVVSKYIHEELIEDLKSMLGTKLPFYNNFENVQSKSSHYGKGSFTLETSGYNRIFDSDREGIRFVKDSTYIASFWFFSNAENINATNCIIEEVDKEGKNESWLIQKDVAQFSSIDGDWTLVELPFTITKQSPTIRVITYSSVKNANKILIDDLLLRSVNENVVSKYKKDYYFNNYILEKK